MVLYSYVKHRERGLVSLEVVHPVAVILLHLTDDLSLVVTLAVDRVKFIRKQDVVETHKRLAQPIKLFISVPNPQDVNVFN